VSHGYAARQQLEYKSAGSRTFGYNKKPLGEVDVHRPDAHGDEAAPERQTRSAEDDADDGATREVRAAAEADDADDDREYRDRQQRAEEHGLDAEEHAPP
jgi:hypothetical protein